MPEPIAGLARLWPRRVALWIGAAERPVPADDKSGLHVCFDAPNRKSVDAFHAAALRAGGRDNGKPGLRADYGADYYAAFVVDPDGYRLEAYCGQQELRGRPSRHTGETPMASIHKEILIDARPEDVWAAIRDVGAIHRRLAPGFVVDTRLDGDARIVTFGNGLVARELIVDIGDAARRLVWSVVGGRMTHHNASLQVFADGEGRSRVVWIADLLPNDLARIVGGMIEQGMGVMQKTLERSEVGNDAD